MLFLRQRHKRLMVGFDWLVVEVELRKIVHGLLIIESDSLREERNQIMDGLLLNLGQVGPESLIHGEVWLLMLYFVDKVTRVDFMHDSIMEMAVTFVMVVMHDHVVVMIDDLIAIVAVAEGWLIIVRVGPPEVKVVVVLVISFVIGARLIKE